MSEKGKKLRPLRILLAGLIVILFVMILNRLPKAKTTVKTVSKPAQETSLASLESNSDSKDLEGGVFIYATGLLDFLESALERRLDSLGVPEEEYKNVGEYLSKQELFELEQKVSLASNLDESWIYAEPSELKSLERIFSESFISSLSATLEAPNEYKPLADHLKEYETALTTVEDYDEVL